MPSLCCSRKCCPWCFSCREVSQATGTIFGAFLVRCCFLVWQISLNDRMDGTNNLLRDKPLCPTAAGTASAAAARAAGQNSCLLKQELHSSEASASPQPLHINNCQCPGAEHCFFYAADNSLKWYCLAKKINQRLMGEQSRFKSTSSGCFQPDFCFPSHCAV